MTEPRTAAGRALLAECEDMDWPTLPDAILDIEAEAVAPYQAVVEAARVVNEHYMDGHPYLACHTGDHMPALAAALAAIEGSTE